MTRTERPELCDKPAPNIVEILSVTNVALSLCSICNCQRRKKKVKQLWAAFYPANHQMNLHAPLLDCPCVRSAGLCCNVKSTNPDVFCLWSPRRLLRRRQNCLGNINAFIPALESLLYFSFVVWESIPYWVRFLKMIIHVRYSLTNVMLECIQNLTEFVADAC